MLSKYLIVEEESLLKNKKHQQEIVQNCKNSKSISFFLKISDPENAQKNLCLNYNTQFWCQFSTFWNLPGIKRNILFNFSEKK
jgi:hypothetical protein